MDITFHSEFAGFELGQKKRHRDWIRAQIRERNKQPVAIAFVFTTNEDLRKINRTYLNHDYFTDVITFGYGEDDRISGDIYISVDQVRGNAGEYGVSFEEELRRVMSHGVLHLLGFNDSNEKERRRMRELEEEALNLWSTGEGDG